MRYRRLGNSGLKVSTVSLGSWLTYGSAVEVDTATECVKAAYEAGVILFDTADIYDRGGAEACLGQAFKRIGMRRQDIVVATKAFWPMTQNANDRGLSRKHLTESLDASLKRLGTDYVDLYQCHRYDPETPLEELVRTMDIFIKQGRVLYWGISVWEKSQIEEVCEIADSLGMPRPISNQPAYSLLERTIERDILPTCEKNGMGQVVFSPLAQGLLTGKYASESSVPAGSRASDSKRGQFIKPMLTKENIARVEKLKPIARELGVSVSAVAVAFVLSQKSVASALTGATRPAQVAENVSGADIDLDDATLHKLDAIFPPGRYLDRSAAI